MRLLGQKSQKYTENIAKFPAQWQQSTKINLIKKQNVFRKNLFIFVRLHHVWHLWGLHLRGKTQNQKGELQNGFLPLFPFPSHHPLLHTPSNSLHPYNSFSVHTHTDRLKKTNKQKNHFQKWDHIVRINFLLSRCFKETTSHWFSHFYTTRQETKEFQGF